MCVTMCSNQLNISQAFLNDSHIEKKLDFSRPINFVTHGWLSGLLDRNMHLLGFDDKPNEYDGTSVQNYYNFLLQLISYNP